MKEIEQVKRAEAKAQEHAQVVRERASEAARVVHKYAKATSEDVTLVAKCAGTYVSVFFRTLVSR